MKTRFLVPGLIVVGFSVLLAGLAWNTLVPTSTYWTPAQAEEFAAAQTDLHAQWHNHLHGKNEQQAEAAKHRFLEISEKLDAARASRRKWKAAFIAAGVVFLVAAIALHLNHRPD